MQRWEIGAYCTQGAWPLGRQEHRTAHCNCLWMGCGMDHTCGLRGQLLRECAFLPIELGIIVMVC